MDGWPLRVQQPPPQPRICNYSARNVKRGAAIRPSKQSPSYTALFIGRRRTTEGA